LESHYSPKKKLILGNIESLKKEFSHTRIAVLRFTKEGPAMKNEIVLSEKGDLAEAAMMPCCSLLKPNRYWPAARF
jgi:L-threonylcarbamoyladenylate synthase